MESGKWKVENGKWKMENGKWRVENGKWKVRKSPPLESPALFGISMEYNVCKLLPTKSSFLVT